MSDLNLVIINLRKYKLFFQTHRIITPSLEPPPRPPPEIPYSWQGKTYQPVKEFVHSVSPEGNLASYRHPFFQFKTRNGFFCLRYHRLLTCYQGKFFLHRIEEFNVLYCLSKTDIKNTLLNLWYLHNIHV